MKFVPARDLRIRPGKVWKSLSAHKEVIVTSNGKPVALMTPVSAETLEEDLEVLRRAKALRALERIQAEAVRSGRSRVSDEEIEAERKAVRKAWGK